MADLLQVRGVRGGLWFGEEWYGSEEMPTMENEEKYRERGGATVMTQGWLGSAGPADPWLL